MGEFDASMRFVDELLGEFRSTRTGFDRGMNIGTERRDDMQHGGGIVPDRLIGEDFSILVHDTNLNDFLMVVKTDKNW